MNRVSTLPGSPGSRLLKLGRLAGGVAAGMAAEGARRLVSGELPSAGDLLLTRKNAGRIEQHLSELRGAAMKVGQLLSMEAGDLLPPELSAALARLREGAHQMPMMQVAGVLDQAWGPQWTKRFKRFNFQPLAAASIGQVHEAVGKDGRRLAIKIQYPGVRESIDSDVDNVARLLTLVRSLPNRADVAPLLEDAKLQLHQESDYLREASLLESYREHLGDHPLFVLPEVIHDWTTAEVLSMSYLPGEALETLEQEPRLTRDRICSELLELALHELFDWGLVQTDPNFANYRYDRQTGRVGLLDFGAARSYPPEQTSAWRRLFAAAMERDTESVIGAAEEIGYIAPDDPGEYREAMVDLLLDAMEPARHAGEYDFSRSELAARMSKKVIAMRVDADYWRLPPPQVLFMHRKLGGLYMLFARLGARIDVRRSILSYT